MATASCDNVTAPLSLDICRELKAAGFAQSTARFHVARISEFPDGQETWTVEADWPSPTDTLRGSVTQKIACPNSDEIIAALPTHREYFKGVFYKLSLTWDTSGWIACYRDISEGTHIKPYVQAKSADEALARLFLALRAAKGEAS